MSSSSAHECNDDKECNSYTLCRHVLDIIFIMIINDNLLSSKCIACNACAILWYETLKKVRHRTATNENFEERKGKKCIKANYCIDSMSLSSSVMTQNYRVLSMIACLFYFISFGSFHVHIYIVDMSDDWLEKGRLEIFWNMRVFLGNFLLLMIVTGVKEMEYDEFVSYFSFC